MERPVLSIGIASMGRKCFSPLAGIKFVESLDDALQNAAREEILSVSVPLRGLSSWKDRAFAMGNCKIDEFQSPCGD